MREGKESTKKGRKISQTGGEDLEIERGR